MEDGLAPFNSFSTHPHHHAKCLASSFIAAQECLELFTFTIAWAPNSDALFNNCPSYTGTSIIALAYSIFVLHYLLAPAVFTWFSG